MNKIINNDEIENIDFKEGVAIENKLHDYFIEFVKPEMTFERIYTQMNKYIDQFGYVNIDFMRNTGHTIEKIRDERLYFAEGNTKTVTPEKLFTFEPHIKKMNGKWGFKYENIYYFCKDKVEIL